MKRSYMPRKPYQWRKSTPLRRTQISRGRVITSAHSTTDIPKDIRAGKPLGVGKKGRDWIAVRRQLSADFAARGITTCELGYESCWGANALGFAHGRKRRHLQDGELKSLTILICNPCHDKIEYLPAAEMLAIVESVIEKRKKVA